MVKKVVLVVCAVVLAVVSAVNHLPADAAALDGWNYDATSRNGPRRWGVIASEYADCIGGEAQSPINILGAKTNNELVAIRHRFYDSFVTGQNDGHTTKIVYEPRSWTFLRGRWYELKEVVFRTPSEHTVRGIQFPLEIQLVHQAPNGRKAIVSSMWVEGKEHVELGKLLRFLPRTKGIKTFPDDKFNARTLLPGEPRAFVVRQPYYAYTGSLSTPPCTEEVDWFIYSTFLQASDYQLGRIRTLFKDGNARPVQALHGRRIEKSPALPVFPDRADLVPLFPEEPQVTAEDLEKAKGSVEAAEKIAEKKQRVEQMIQKAREDEIAGIPNPINVPVVRDPAEVWEEKRQAEDEERLRADNPALYSALSRWQQAAKAPTPTPVAQYQRPLAQGEAQPPLGNPAKQPPTPASSSSASNQDANVAPGDANTAAADKKFILNVEAPATNQVPAAPVSESQGFQFANKNSPVGSLPTQPGLSSDVLLEDEDGKDDIVHDPFSEPDAASRAHWGQHSTPYLGEMQPEWQTKAKTAKIAGVAQTHIATEDHISEPEILQSSNIMSQEEESATAGSGVQATHDTAPDLDSLIESDPPAVVDNNKEKPKEKEADRKKRMDKERKQFAKAADNDSKTNNGRRISMDDQANDPFRAKTQVLPPNQGEGTVQKKKIAREVGKEVGAVPETAKDVLGPNSNVSTRPERNAKLSNSENVPLDNTLVNQFVFGTTRPKPTKVEKKK